jgi:CubicO group peptidase (beta-lactamase class C family)
VVVAPEGVLEVAGEIDAVFALASVTKLLTTYATLVAIEEGSVALDDEVGPPGATLRHLLAHASGLGAESGDGVVDRPGSRRIYSNLGFEMLAAHVEKATGITFAAYLDEAVFAPLAMRSTSLEGSAARAGRSSAGDLASFLHELLVPSVLAPESVAEATAVAFPGLAGVLPGFGLKTPCDWGLGFELKDHKRPHWTGSLQSIRTFGHFGQSGTFCSVDPDELLGIVVLTDKAFGTAAKRTWPLLADGVVSRHRAGTTAVDTLRPMSRTDEGS